mmetsp:Transcript_12174/g.37478  ORF Transcript_12174/g.37478 Transcript_12174/m.37478 type:complete len:249 (+) Transcript_12174:893-1639(+)
MVADRMFRLRRPSPHVGAAAAAAAPLVSSLETTRRPASAEYPRRGCRDLFPTGLPTSSCRAQRHLEGAASLRRPGGDAAPRVARVEQRAARLVVPGKREVAHAVRRPEVGQLAARAVDDLRTHTLGRSRFAKISTAGTRPLSATHTRILKAPLPSSSRAVHRVANLRHFDKLGVLARLAVGDEDPVLDARRHGGGSFVAVRAGAVRAAAWGEAASLFPPWRWRCRRPRAGVPRCASPSPSPSARGRAA